MASFASDDRVRRACWCYARRFAPGDRWDRYQDGMLAVLEGERAGRVRTPHAAIVAAKGGQFNRARSDRRERGRLARYAEIRRAMRRDMPPGERADVDTYLAALTDPEFRAVVLKLWGFLGHAEVAAFEGISRLAAQLRYQRGIARLRDRYNGHADRSFGLSPDATIPFIFA
jgi:DNA-directed RNA polymerase specialized sigma24 family protein